jgi:hypothetical protein
LTILAYSATLSTNGSQAEMPLPLLTMV